MDNERIKEKTKADLDEDREWYKLFVAEFQDVDRRLFQLKLAFGGLIGIVVAFLIPNVSGFSKTFSIGVLLILFAIIVLLAQEIWKDAKERFQKLQSKLSSVILFRIRHIVAVEMDKNPSLLRYGTEAEALLKEDAILKEIMAGTTIKEIIRKNQHEASWKWHILIWTTLVLCIPALFLYEMLLK